MWTVMLCLLWLLFYSPGQMFISWRFGGALSPIIKGYKMGWRTKSPLTKSPNCESLPKSHLWPIISDVFTPYAFLDHWWTWIRRWIFHNAKSIRRCTSTSIDYLLHFINTDGSYMLDTWICMLVCVMELITVLSWSDSPILYVFAGFSRLGAVVTTSR